MGGGRFVVGGVRCGIRSANFEMCGVRWDVLGGEYKARSPKREV